MGMFDSVYVPCPSCGAHKEFQSKSGPCLLDAYELKNAPVDVLADVNRHAPATCGCGVQFGVGFTADGPKSMRWAEAEVAGLDATTARICELGAALLEACDIASRVISDTQVLPSTDQDRIAALRALARKDKA